MLVFLDVLFTLLHCGVIGFNLFAWLFPQTRRAHSLVAGLTLLSWLGLGVYYGWGYCFLTDWHWEVKRALGQDDLPASFIHYMVREWLGLDLAAAMVDWLTVLVFFIAIGCSLYVNFRRSSGKGKSH